MASRSVGDTPCKCGNKNKSSFLEYLNDDEEGLLGVFCSECGKEYLKEEYLQSSRSDDSIRFHGNVLLLNKRRQATDENFEVQYNRTKVENLEYAVDMFKAGDHIQWERNVYDHHAIVEKIDVLQKTIQVIQYKKVGFCKIVISRNTITIDEKSITNMYRIDYEEIQTDPCHLILARARAWLDQAGYNLFTRNCETFSFYCVMGTLVSWQAVWFAGSVIRCIRSVLTKTCWKTGIEVAFAELIESASTGAAMSNLVGAGIVIAIEGTAIAVDVTKLYSKRKEGRMSWKDFLRNTIYKIVEGLTTAGFIVGGSILGEVAGGALGTLICPGVGTVLGMFIGSIIGGIVAAVPGKMCGTFMGRKFGRAIAATVKNDDKLVVFDNLKRGDQIVMCAWGLHPRCHAIVTEVNKDKRTMKIIRNTYAEGVIEEEMNFTPPVYRVMYTNNQRHTVEDTIRRARSKLGDKKYNIVTNNCKHFACWCIQSSSS